MSWRLVVAVACALLAMVLAGWALRCPCERVPGIWVGGNTVTAPVQDWSMANDVEHCELQVQGPVLPHAITLNCMSAAGTLYVSCSRCEGKFWSGQALKHPLGRIRIGANSYPVRLTRVTDPAELDVAWAARSAKLGGQPGPRPDHWWSFRLTSP